MRTCVACVYACGRAYVYVCGACTCLRERVCTPAAASVRLCVYVPASVRIRVHDAYAYAYMYVRAYVCGRVRGACGPVCTCGHTLAPVYVPACMCVPLRVCVYALTHARPHTRTPHTCGRTRAAHICIPAYAYPRLVTLVYACAAVCVTLAYK